MELTFTETPYGLYFSEPGQWIPPGQDYQHSQKTKTCWPRLARPTVNWSSTAGVVSNEVLLEAGQIGSFPLFDHMGNMLAYPENDGLGFLILGHNEEMHFNTAACVSQIENVTLNVTYVTRVTEVLPIDKTGF